MSEVFSESSSEFSAEALLTINNYKFKKKKQTVKTSPPMEFIYLLLCSWFECVLFCGFKILQDMKAERYLWRYYRLPIKWRTSEGLVGYTFVKRGENCDCHTNK